MSENSGECLRIRVTGECLRIKENVRELRGISDERF
jgi:hypothetical protein